MAPIVWLAAAAIGLAGTVAAPALADIQSQQVVRLDARTAMAQSKRSIGRTLDAFRLIDSHGAPLPLQDYRCKPLVISLVYTACSSICPPTTQHLIDVVNEAVRVFGADRFNVLTVGFDARNDTPGRLIQFASSQGIKFKNWRLAGGDAVTIESLLSQLGFSYSAIAGGFDHVTQTTIVDRDGRIYRHVYGDDFPLTAFVEPMKDLIYGGSRPFSLTNLVDRVKFICTVYDPGAGRYRIDYGLAFGSVLGALSLVIFGGLLYREWSRTEHA